MAPEDVSGPLGLISAWQRSPAVKSSRCVSLSRRGNARLALPWACLLLRSPRVECRPKGQRAAPARFEGWGGVILGLSLALFWHLVRWLRTSQSVFLLNRNLHLEPICGSSFEGRISCVQRFVLRLSFSCFHGSFCVAEAGKFGCTTISNLGDAQVLCLCPPPLPAHGWSFVSFLGKLGDSRWDGTAVRPRGRMRPNLRSALACIARTKCGTADRGEIVKPCLLCSLTARCLHLGTSALLTLYFILGVFFLTFRLSGTCSPRALVWAVCLLLRGAALLWPWARSTVEIGCFSWLFKLFVVSIYPPSFLPALCLPGWWCHQLICMTSR